MKIGMDVHGGDLGAPETVQAALRAVRELGTEMVLFGDRAVIEKELGAEVSNSNIQVVHCSERVENEDTPTLAIRRKKDSSLVVGLTHLKERKIDGFVTAGNTGAVLAGGIFVVGRIKGISRPAICTVFPVGKRPSVLLDTGANAECKPGNLLEFALMGSLYADAVLGYTNPTVGLVNIGAEDHKGTPMHIEAYQLLKNNKAGINFVGNVEGRDVPSGSVDVIVADGFSGNIVLKLTEGVAKELLGAVKSAIMSSFVSKIGGALIKGSLSSLKKRLDYTEYGGAPILGVDGVLVKAHGSSNAKAFFNAVRYAEFAAKENIVEKIREGAQKLNAEAPER
ncbi:MAG: phosphate acyltransferase PlsX [Bacillota bacterium]|nr:phosphate acyltransferase PlsX [Bacillota bacterium]